MLSDLKVGENAVLVNLNLPDSVQNHLMHMGFVPDAQVTVLRRAPAGDPTVYSVDGMEVALRYETASAIETRPYEENVPELHPAGRGEVKAPVQARPAKLIEAAR
jgi:ferrous iron transport protein A